jgi:carbon-monoxide dehydrogenase medium subunit
MLRPFHVLDPTSVAEAAAELGRLGERAKVYAGGAELLLLLRQGILSADYLVNVKRIAGLDAIAWDGERVRIGATVLHRRLETDPLVRERLPLLAYAESHVGNVRVRNQGTLGGNLCFADPHADPATALLVHDATVTVGGADGERELPLAEFLVGTYEVALASDELLTAVQAAPLPAGWRHAYLRVEQFYRPTLNVAAAVRPEGDRIGEARLAVGCVGPKAVRLEALEARVRGLTVAEARCVATEAKGELEELLEPVDDLLGSAAYKLHVTSVLLGRALAQAVGSDGGGAHG